MRRPIEVSWAGAQDLPRVPARCDDEGEQGGARVLLSDGLSPVVGAAGPRGGGSSSGWAKLHGMWVAGGMAGHQVGSGGEASHTREHRGVCLACALHEYRSFPHLKIHVRRV